ncbi:Uncharacterised protein [Enterobacter cloacae]|nr:Uncharacterised protein [Enterobacter cloacae]VAU69542.1 Uncharacterised protein [Klebsiella pneumoniae]
MRNAQRFTPIFYQFSFPPGDDCNFNTGRERTADTVTVANVKGFQLFAVIAHINQTVGEHTIHIEDQQADIFRL